MARAESIGELPQDLGIRAVDMAEENCDVLNLDRLEPLESRNGCLLRRSL